MPHAFGAERLVSMRERRFVPRKREEVTQLAQTRLASRLALVPMFSDLDDRSLQACPLAACLREPALGFRACRVPRLPSGLCAAVRLHELRCCLARTQLVESRCHVIAHGVLRAGGGRALRGAG